MQTNKCNSNIQTVTTVKFGFKCHKNVIFSLAERMKKEWKKIVDSGKHWFLSGIAHKILVIYIHLLLRMCVFVFAQPVANTRVSWCESLCSYAQQSAIWWLNDLTYICTSICFSLWMYAVRVTRTHRTCYNQEFGNIQPKLFQLFYVEWNYSLWEWNNCLVHCHWYRYIEWHTRLIRHRCLFHVFQFYCAPGINVLFRLGDNVLALWPKRR